MQETFFGNLFLSAGAMKAGTTWLYRVLSRHPDLYFTPEKELHYFYHRHVDPTLLNDRRRMSEARAKLTRLDPAKMSVAHIRDQMHWAASYLTNPVDDFWYRGLFAGQHRQSYGCDFSNLYALLPSEAWARIHADCNRLRVLYTLRHPLKRLWSHVKFQLQMDGNLEALKSWGADDFERFARQDFLWVNCEYGQALRRMRAGLPKETLEQTLKVIFFEDLHADQRGMLAEIESFLGIRPRDYSDALLGRQVNRSADHPMPAFFPDLFATDVERITGELQDLGLTPPAQWSAPLRVHSA